MIDDDDDDDDDDDETIADDDSHSVLSNEFHTETWAQAFWIINLILVGVLTFKPLDKQTHMFHRRSF